MKDKDSVKVQNNTNVSTIHALSCYYAYEQ